MKASPAISRAPPYGVALYSGADQFSEAPALQFLHHPRLVNLDGARADGQARRDLPMRQPFDQQIEHLALTRCQSREPGTQGVLGAFRGVPMNVLANCILEDVQENLVVDRLFQKIEGA